MGIKIEIRAGSNLERSQVGRKIEDISQGDRASKQKRYKQVAIVEIDQVEGSKHSGS